MKKNPTFFRKTVTFLVMVVFVVGGVLIPQPHSNTEAQSIPDVIRIGHRLLDGCEELAGLQDALQSALEAGVGAIDDAIGASSFFDDFINDTGVGQSLKALAAGPVGAIAGPILGAVGGKFLGGLLGGDTKQAIQEVLDKKSDQKERCLDALAQEAAQRVLQNVSDDVLNWIRFGFEAGNPGFVKDLEKRLLEVGSREFNRLVQKDETFRGLCTQFIDTIQDDLYTNFVTNLTDGAGGYTSSDLRRPDPITPCTLENVLNSVGAAIDDGNGGGGGGGDDGESRVNAFLSGNFFIGGWDGVETLATDPKSNPIFAGEQQRVDLEKKTQEAADNEKETIQASGGFLDDKRCEDGIPTGASGLCCQDGTSPLSGAVITGEINADDLLDDERVREKVGVCFDENANTYPPDTPPITATPAGIVSRVIDRLIESDFGRAELVDEQNEVIPEFVDLLVGGVTRVGLLFAPSNKVHVPADLPTVGTTPITAFSISYLFSAIQEQIQTELAYYTACNAIEEMTGVPNPLTVFTQQHPLDVLGRNFIDPIGLELIVPTFGILTQPLLGNIADPVAAGPQCAAITGDPQWNTVQNVWLPDIQNAINNYDCSGILERVYGPGGDSAGVEDVSYGSLLWDLSINPEDRGTVGDPDFPIEPDDGGRVTLEELEEARGAFSAMVTEFNEKFAPFEGTHNFASAVRTANQTIRDETDPLTRGLYGLTTNINPGDMTILLRNWLFYQSSCQVSEDWKNFVIAQAKIDTPLHPELAIFYVLYDGDNLTGPLGEMPNIPGQFELINLLQEPEYTDDVMRACGGDDLVFLNNLANAQNNPGELFHEDTAVFDVTTPFMTKADVDRYISIIHFEQPELYNTMRTIEDQAGAFFKDLKPGLDSALEIYIIYAQNLLNVATNLQNAVGNVLEGNIVEAFEDAGVGILRINELAFNYSCPDAVVPSPIVSVDWILNFDSSTFEGGIEFTTQGVDSCVIEGTPDGTTDTRTLDVFIPSNPNQLTIEDHLFTIGTFAGAGFGDPSIIQVRVVCGNDATNEDLTVDMNPPYLPGSEL